MAGAPAGGMPAAPAGGTSRAPSGRAAPRPPAGGIAPLPDADARLAALAERVRDDLRIVRHPSRAWVPPVTAPDGSEALDVLVVGAGQCGLATAFALHMECVERVRVIDRAPRGREGPWVTFARMVTLRTPKHLVGPDLGIPSLTPQAWFVAKYGAPAWAALGRIAREVWMDYLDWYRTVLALPVENDTTLRRLEGVRSGAGWLVAATLDTPAGRTVVHARRVVLATGMDGSGEWAPPAFLADRLPRHRYAHTAEAIDYAALAGRRIGILGAGASAFDNAGTALEAGVASVDLFFRRERLPVVNPNRWMEQSGILAHWGDLDDLRRWRWLRHFFVVNQPPPQDTFERCVAFDDFRLHARAPWTAVREHDGAVEVTTPQGTHRFDFVVAGTGFVVDLARREDHAGFASDVALWRDRFTPPAGEDHPVLPLYPYLGAGFEYVERTPGAKPWIAQIHNFTWGSHLSNGISGGAISPMRYALRRLVPAITRGLFLEDADRHYASLLAYDEAELVAPAFAALLAAGRD